MTQSDCIVYKNSSLKNGYGRMWSIYKNNTGLAHRVVWEKKYGLIPEGLEIHHFCKNKMCLNTEHMCLLSRKAHAILTNNEKEPKKFCKRGHIIDGINSKQRYCKICNSIRQKKYIEKNREKINAYRKKWRKARKVKDAKGIGLQ